MTMENTLYCPFKIEGVLQMDQATVWLQVVSLHATPAEDGTALGISDRV